MGFFSMNYVFWGTPIYGKPHVVRIGVTRVLLQTPSIEAPRTLRRDLASQPQGQLLAEGHAPRGLLRGGQSKQAYKIKMEKRRNQSSSEFTILGVSNDPFHVFFTTIDQAVNSFVFILPLNQGRNLARNPNVSVKLAFSTQTIASSKESHLWCIHPQPPRLGACASHECSRQPPPVLVPPRGRSAPLAASQGRGAWSK